MAGKFDIVKLASFGKDELVSLVLQLQEEKMEIAKNLVDLNRNLESRVVALERSQFLYEQYGRRESLEITGIPKRVDQNALEDEVIKIFNEAKVEVHGKKLEARDIAACHRIGRKGETTICKFVSRKFAYAGLVNGKNLKGSKLYGDGNIFINNSLCREFSHYGYLIRKLKKSKAILGYTQKHGVYHIKRIGQDDFVEISHVSDFKKYGLDVNSIE